MNRWLVLVASLPLLAAVAVLGIAGAGWNEARHWPIRWLEVAGELERVSAAQIRAALADQARMGFFGLDVDRARRDIEALPWVESAAVARRWPDALNIEVREQRAVARWNGQRLVGASGVVFDVAGTEGMQGLTLLSGPEDRQREVFEYWRILRARLGAQGLEIAALALDPRGAWQIRLGAGPELLLGRENADVRLARFVSVRERLGELARYARIDLRYPNGLAVTTRQAAASAAQLARRSRSGPEEALPKEGMDGEEA